MLVRKIALVFAVLFCTNTHADFYKCTDAKGNITYSNSACGSTNSKTVEASDHQITQSNNDSSKQSSTAQVQKPNAVPANQPQTYHCDGRIYCSQMTSCEEAKFFLKNCPGTKMDGGRPGEKPDGVPCESQWCN